MLRTKKKQLNLKPNRVLDKRTSRGMLYENEELRLRTIHINDEVEKGHHDIKKLRKENEYLKREIWSLRDECEKLEEVIKKVYAGDPPPEDQLPKYQPRVRKMSTFSGKWENSGRRGSGMSFSNYSFYDENESEERDDADNDDDDQSYDDAGPFHCNSSQEQYQGRTSEHQGRSNEHQGRGKSVLEKQNSQDFEDYPEDLANNPQIFLISTTEPDVTSTAETMENLEKIGYFTPPPLHQHWQMHAPDLETVTEDTESNNASMNLSEQPLLECYGGSAVVLDRLNNPMCDIRYIDSRSTSVASEFNLGEAGEGVTNYGANNYSGLELLQHQSSLDMTNNESGTSFEGNPEREGSSDNSYTLAPFFNPKIEITPASSPTSTTKKSSEESTENPGSTNTNNQTNNTAMPMTAGGVEIQDLGCVTLIPKKYQVTSELKILPDQILPASSCAAPSSASRETEVKKKCEHQQTSPSNFLTAASQSEDNLERSNSTSPAVSTVDIEALRIDQTLPRKRSSLPRPHLKIPSLNNNNPQQQHLSVLVSAHAASSELSPFCDSSTAKSYKTLSFHSDSLGKSTSKIAPLYQSEPSLTCLQYGEVEQEPKGEIIIGWNLVESHKNNLVLSSNQMLPQLVAGVGGGFHGFDQSVEMCAGLATEFRSSNNDFMSNPSSSGWNSVDKNLIIGYLDERSSHPGLWNDVSAQEVIDELEAQFDTTLDKIAGVRMLTLPGFSPRRIFISMRTAVNVKLLLDKGFTLRGNRVRLQDASQAQAGSSLVSLSGVPASFPDSLVISALNQFGQVVAPLERRIYKGVDISERLARMHLVRNLPTPCSLAISGCEVFAKVVNHSDQPIIPPTHSPLISGITPTAGFNGAPTGKISLDAPTKPLRAAPGYVNFRPTPVLRPTSFHQQQPPQRPSSPTSIPRHKPVTRSATLESALPSPGISAPSSFQQLGPTAAAVNKRKMSICSAVMDGSAAIPSSPGPGGPKPALLGNPKKPLTRIPRSSPGSLTPTPTTSHPPGTEMFIVDSTGVKPLLRSMSFEPRKMSNLSKRASTDGSQLSLPDSGSGQYPGAAQPGIHPGGRQRYYQQHGQMSNSNSSNFRSLDKKESLPWCGCWGNGCV